MKLRSTETAGSTSVANGQSLMIVLAGAHPFEALNTLDGVPKVGRVERGNEGGLVAAAIGAVKQPQGHGGIVREGLERPPDRE
jgi:adenosine/AMP kinase